MSESQEGRRVAFLVAPEGAEEVELTEPWRAVAEAGASPVLVSTTTGPVQAFNHLDRGGEFDVDRVVDDVSADDFDALVLPGGVANPDQLRTDDRAVAFVREFFNAGKPVAVICHGPWTLIEAGVLAGRRITSWPSLRTDIINAGGDWVDEALVRCDGGSSILLSSRKPDDLPAFCDALVAELSAQEVPL
ncbi:glutamine amidotransferase [Mycolicibacter terrae]|jgi:protease I|uniref:Glutamine amidotransferase n=1 Tax=Mycolicibacter terrae TaxID=1788 RepID=A0AAD1MEP6_9MYCO|nr:type 1 glutamine amidotransferase domain-containing protein [Mycolicibacter terrae]ORW93109.1 glutamine amidotransferase [Mycolicibacter terrae]BBX21567.1 glutamine amidotransferase [Mycolicibacter terrae]SNV87917.1 PfpI family intracellular protease [Mycolicibacter terrae]